MFLLKKNKEEQGGTKVEDEVKKKKTKVVEYTVEYTVLLETKKKNFTRCKGDFSGRKKLFLVDSTCR